MIVKILEYDSRKGIGVYQELNKKKSKQAFRYDKFYKQQMIPAGEYASASSAGVLKPVTLGYFRKLWLKITGVF